MFLSLISFGQDSLAVLFLGNSYTGVNNLPLLVKNLTLSAGKTILVEANLPGGSTLSDHLNNGTSVNKIRERNWDYIVLQEQSQIPAIDYYRYNSMYPSLIKLKDTIEFYNPCAKIITFLTWGRRLGGIQCDPGNIHCSPDFVDYNHMQDTLTSAYLAISEQLNIQCAPVGVAWQSILRDTSIILHNGDNSHPNIYGSYVAACTIFSSIWKQGSSGLSYTAGISLPLVQYFQSRSDNIIFNSLNNWNLYINIPKANFGESISGNTATFTNLSTSIDSSLHYFWDFGDGNNAVMRDPIHSYTADGTYIVSLIASNCVSSDTITKIIEIKALDYSFEIFPNPTSNQINLKVDRALIGKRYFIYDNSGKTLLYGEIDSEITFISLSTLLSGIYFVTAGDKLRYTMKVLKN